MAIAAAVIVVAVVCGAWPKNKHEKHEKGFDALSDYDQSN